jgi:hypothetical protein
MHLLAWVTLPLYAAGAIIADGPGRRVSIGIGLVLGLSSFAPLRVLGSREAPITLAEFSIVLPGASLVTTCQLAERVQLAVEALHQEHAASPDGHVSVSVGAASAVPDQDSPEELIRAADHALYEAKNHGRTASTSDPSPRPALHARPTSKQRPAPVNAGPDAKPYRPGCTPNNHHRHHTAIGGPPASRVPNLSGQNT